VEDGRVSVFFTADWHLGWNRVDLLARPYRNAGEMIGDLIARHNAAVDPDDTVYVVGDALHATCAEYAPLLAHLNGHLTLIRGNHDVLPDADLEPYFDLIVAEGDGVEIDVEGVPCWMTHYPTRARPDRFNLVGHVHGAWRLQRNMLNVGVDAHHLAPMPARMVRFHLEAIRLVHDDDVWCSDHPANTAHADRGRPGVYLPVSA
jgi:calcineurin-like phosphoesterase family protein